jgi:muramoyltetrapeptide carboxypeptidase
VKVQKVVRIGVVAPSSPIKPEAAERALALAEAAFPGRVQLIVHPQCYDVWRHFAGEDEARAEAFARYANDESLDAIWFARGGYGACRVAETALSELGDAARAKTYLGYSDSGFILAGLHKMNVGRLAHGPMLNDFTRKGGEAALKRALAFLIEGAADSLEPNYTPGVKHAAFNLTVLSHLLGTPLEPDLTDHVLMLEDVSEHMYRFDRALFHVTSSPNVRSCAGIRLGRISDVPENDPPFGAEGEEVTQYWCARAGIAYLGRADIGHDVDNKIVPFGA